MFCSGCGEKLIEGAQFCIKCGQKRIIQQATGQQQRVSEQQVVKQQQRVHGQNEEINLVDLVGINQPYYAAQFEQIEKRGKGSFFQQGFLVTIFPIMGYRKMYKQLCISLLPWLFLELIGILVWFINHEVGSVIAGLGICLMFGFQIYYVCQFNKSYYFQLRRIREKAMKLPQRERKNYLNKRAGTSIGLAIAIGSIVFIGIMIQAFMAVVIELEAEQLLLEDNISTSTSEGGEIKESESDLSFLGTDEYIIEIVETPNMEILWTTDPMMQVGIGQECVNYTLSHLENKLGTHYEFYLVDGPYGGIMLKYFNYPYYFNFGYIIDYHVVEEYGVQMTGTEVIQSMFLPDAMDSYSIDADCAARIDAYNRYALLLTDVETEEILMKWLQEHPFTKGVSIADSYYPIELMGAGMEYNPYYAFKICVNNAQWYQIIVSRNPANPEIYIINGMDYETTLSQWYQMNF